ncbi:MAG: hypothetical protein IJ679_02895 [Lachnospiraceae bacterium]|nr:hypothetical protein [Lachnospiraceae bacterium]
MKHIVFGMCAALLIVSILMNTMTIEGTSLRNREMKNALHCALEEALQDAISREHYDTADNELLLADATALLMNQLNANDKNLTLSLDIAGVDARAGLLSVHASETFTYPDGQTGEVEDTATVILEREVPKNRYNIVYEIPKATMETLLLPKEVRRYCIEERQPLSVPDTPSVMSEKGWTISAWVDKTTNTSYTRDQLLKTIASKDMTLVAVVEKK